MPPRKSHIIIDATIDEPSRMTPALGQVDRLLKQSMIETQSLQVVRGLLLRDTLDRAKTNGNGKLLAAANLRNNHRRELPPAPKPRQKNGMDARQKEKMAKTAICGPRLNLFLLERLDNDEYQTNTQILQALRDTGKANHIKRLSGVYGLLTSEGFVKKDDERGYKRTALGRNFAIQLRADLEEHGEVMKGEYLAPAGYVFGSKRRHGYTAKGGVRSH